MDGDDDSGALLFARHQLFPARNSRLTSEVDLGIFHQNESAYSSDAPSYHTELDAASVHLDHAIIQDIHNSGQEGASSDKFRYLDMYERAARMRNPDTESVFGLHYLSDFSRFTRKTELNDRIQTELQNLQLQHEDNLLSIVDSEDLTKRYFNDKDTEQDSDVREHVRNKWWPDRSRNVSSRSEVSELHIKPEAERIFLLRKLKVRHLQMISLGGTLGVGLFLNSGKALTIAGGFGTLLAFLIVGLIVLATITSFCEMVTFISVIDGVSGLSARFVDDSFGFATGWLYFLSFSVGLAGEIVASVIILSYFPNSHVLLNKGAAVGFVTLFLSFTILSNLIDVRVFGEIEYLSSICKLAATGVMIVIMIVVNRGGMGNGGVIGFRYWDHAKSDFDHNIIFGLFRPSFDLHSNGMSPPLEGIGGDRGRFLSFLTAMLIVSYAYSGTEIVCIAACEAKEPRKALPSATKRVFWRILIFYCLASFLVSLNIYAGDPRLLRYVLGNTGVPSSQFANIFAANFAGGSLCRANSEIYGGYANGSQSPWAVAFQSAGLCGWSAVANGFLVFFAMSCGNSQLYASSRTIYLLALQKKAPAFLKKCNRFGIPYNAVIVASVLGFTSFICVSERATVVLQNLTSIISSSGVFVWFAMCLAYVRFYFGLKKRPDIMGRDDKSYPYKGPFQPYSAIFGCVGLAILLFSMGFVVFLKHEWNTWFFFSSYGAPMLFAVLYIGHRVIKGTRTLSLEALDFDSGRREMDMYIWDGGKEFDRRNLKDVTFKVVDFLA